MIQGLGLIQIAPFRSYKPSMEDENNFGKNRLQIRLVRCKMYRMT